MLIHTLHVEPANIIAAVFCSLIVAGLLPTRSLSPSSRGHRGTNAVPIRSRLDRLCPPYESNSNARRGVRHAAIGIKC